MNKNFYRSTGIIMILFIIQAACTFSPSPTPAPTPTKEDEQTSLPPVEGVFMPAFAEYSLISVRLPDTYLGEGYSLPIDLNLVDGLEDLELSDAQLDLLSQNGFAVASPVTGMWQEFYQVYESGRYYHMPNFITTDSIYHVYHLLFDKMLRDLETSYFISDLRSLTTAMLAATISQWETLQGTSLEESALRNVAYFGVADRLLELTDSIPPEAQSYVEAELALIYSASGAGISPLWDRADLPDDEKLIEDYSQYIPRGHYTRTEELKTYFRSMMWYGRLTFRLMDDFETRRALLLTQAIRSASAEDGTPALSLWQDIYEPTVFIVGKADDLGFYEYGGLSDQIFGSSPDLLDFADETLFTRFKDASAALPPPQVNSMWVWIWQEQETVTKGFRFMGQRFTLDAYVFGQLIWRKVGTLDNPRDLPKSLDVLAAMGSEEAYTILDEMGETDYENYESQMTKVRAEVAGFGLDSWTQNLYWSWLYSLQPLFEPKGTQYPAFMQTQAWLRKDMHTALSSWTELKHDTILYAKQVMAEMGGGPDEEPPKGYVEPNPEAYARLLALAEMTRSGLDNRGILDDTTRANLDNLIDELDFLLMISEKELSGVPRTEDEYWEIQYYGGWLESMTIAAADPADPETGRMQIHDQKSALIADVATGIGRVLEEGVGYPTAMYVVVPDQPYQIAMGAVYTYYEFPVGQEERMTDEEWQAMLESGSAPDAPEWTQSFIVP